MAVSVVSTLYPPLIETFQPAFIYTNPAVVTFSLSPFNEIEKIKRIHVSVVDQRNNSNVLKGYMEPTPQVVKIDNEEKVIGYYCIVNGILIADFPEFKSETIAEELGLFYHDPINDIYAIKLNPAWLDRGEDSKSSYWNNNQYYQVQVRFDSSEQYVNGIKQNLNSYNSAELAGYLLDNRSNFSEWSDITLLKPILNPKITINQIDNIENPEISRGNFRITGSIDFQAPTSELNGVTYPEQERLQAYRIEVIFADKEIYDSDWIYAKQNILKSEKTMIDHLLNTDKLPENSDSTVELKIFGRTNNSYEWQESRSLTVAMLQPVFLDDTRWNSKDSGLDKNDIFVNQEDGVAHIRFSSSINSTKKTGTITQGIIYIRRSCSKDNFKNQELVYRYIYKHKGQDNNVTISFDDFTICSLYQYKYSVQMCIIHEEGESWSNIKESNRIYPEFYDMLFMRQNKQIAVRYKGQVASWKPTVNRQKIDTLGGRYPKFVENANMNYKTYSISGLISAEEDFNRMFLDETTEENNTGKVVEDSYSEPGNISRYEERFGNTYQLRNDTYADGNIKNHTINVPEKEKAFGASLYANTEFSGQLNNWHDSYPHNHWYWEREFREELVKWLNDGEPKLYRSMPEGNIAVMLTDINLTPENQLDRMLYDFSATMYEIADGYNLEDLNDLGIIDIPTTSTVFINGADISNGLSEETESANIGDKVSNKIGQIKLTTKVFYDRDNKRQTVNLINGSLNNTSYNPNNLWDNITIIERLKEKYLNDISNEVVDNSVQITNADIQFTSPPNYFNRNANSRFEKVNNKTNWLGYVFNIQFNNSTSQQIFVNQKGFYHIPDTTLITGISMDVEGQTAQMTYVYEYRTRVPEETKFVPTRILKHIIGQYSADYPLPLGTDIISLIKENHNKVNYEISSVTTVVNSIELETCSGLLLDLSPYTVLKYNYKNDNVSYPLLIGETGVFNGFEDWPIESLFIYGRRLTKAKIKNSTTYPYFMEDREYYLDKSVDTEKIQKLKWNSIDAESISDTFNIRINGQQYNLKKDIQYIPTEDSYGYIHPQQISNPKFNTIYRFTKKVENNTPTEFYYQIHYIDGNWYPVVFLEDDSVLAAVPVYGLINYHGNLLSRKTKSNSDKETS